jgi:hypothetical protein
LANGRRPSYRGALAASIFAILAFAWASPQAFAQEVVRLRGTIEEVTADDGYVIRTRDGIIVRFRLAANSSVAASVKSSLSDIQTGLYIGIAAMPQADGSLRALEAHIFDESMRGTAEGHRSWDLLPRSTMTNAACCLVVLLLAMYKRAVDHVAIRAPLAICGRTPMSTMRPAARSAGLVA